MIRVSVLYPNSEGKQFDMQYYMDKHIPMVRQKLGAALKGVAVEVGLAGAAPGTSAAFVALGHLTFASLEEFQAVFGQHGHEILSDIPNYTEIQPIMQISEVKL